MAFFKKDDSFRALVEKLQSPGQMGPTEVAQTIQEVLVMPEANPRRLGFMLHSSHPRIRAAGLEYVLARAGQDAVELILAAMQAVDGSVRGELARTVLRLGRAEAMASLQRTFHGPRTELRSMVLDVAAVDEEWRDWMPVLRHALKTPDAELRRQSVRVLRRRVTDDTAAGVLRDLLHDDDPRLRTEVIHTFCEHPDASIVEHFFARLPFEASTEQARMIEALGRLSRVPKTRIEEHLFPVLSDESAATRSLAVKLLAQMPDSDVVLRRFLIHCRGLASWLRDRAIESMLEMSKELAEPLLRVMDDPDEDVRVQALTLASKLNDPRVVEPAAAIFCSQADWWVRSLAAEILGQFPTEEVLSILLPFVDDPDTRYSVIGVLTKIDRPESTAHLVECLSDPARSIRSTALDGLAGRATEEVIRAVAMTAKCDQEASIRAKALEVVRGFGEMTASIVRILEEELLNRGNPTVTAAGADDRDLDDELSMVNDDLNRS